MTTKRFEINNDMNLDGKIETYELSCIVDNSNKTFYFVVDSIANVECFVERLNELNEENQALKQQLLCDDVCGICKYEYLVPSGGYFIAKCKKGHKECSKEDIKYCKDFEKELKK